MVVASLAQMGIGQLLLASVLLGSYALALGQFVGARGHLITIATAVLAAAGFVALSEPWEAGVILIAFVPLGVGMFAGAAWILWKSTSPRLSALTGPVPRETSSRPVTTVPLISRLWARLRPT